MHADTFRISSRNPTSMPSPFCPPACRPSLANCSAKDRAADGRRSSVSLARPDDPGRGEGGDLVGDRWFGVPGAEKHQASLASQGVDLVLAPRMAGGTLDLQDVLIGMHASRVLSLIQTSLYGSNWMPLITQFD